MGMLSNMSKSDTNICNRKAAQLKFKSTEAPSEVKE